VIATITTFDPTLIKHRVIKAIHKSLIYQRCCTILNKLLWTGFPACSTRKFTLCGTGRKACSWEGCCEINPSCLPLNLWQI